MLLQNVCEEMPPFPARESALLGRLNQKHGDTGDKRTWVIGGKEVNADREASRKSTLPLNGGFADLAAAQNSATQTSEVMNSLAGLDLSTADVSKPEIKPAPKLTTNPDIER